jgi:hypothetical protein
MIEKLTTDILNKFIVEIKKKENLSKIQNNVIDPLIHYTFSQLYPYILGTSIIFILIFILTLLILFFLMKLNIKI